MKSPLRSSQSQKRTSKTKTIMDIIDALCTSPWKSSSFLISWPATMNVKTYWSLDKCPRYSMDQILHIRQRCLINIQWSLPIKNSCILHNDSCILCSDPCIVYSDSCILRSWKCFSWISWFVQQSFHKILSDYYPSQ